MRIGIGDFDLYDLGKCGMIGKNTALPLDGVLISKR